MSTEKTPLSSLGIPSALLLRAGSQKQHAALRHFYGQDEDKRDQRQGTEAYTSKTLRYLLPMLRNRAQAILYVQGEEKGSLSFKHAVHGLCLLSKALGRPAVCWVADKDTSKAVHLLLIFAQHCVVVEASANATFHPLQTAALEELQREHILQKVQRAQPLLSTQLDPKNSAVVLVEWLSKWLKRSLPTLLAGLVKIEQAPSNTPCSLENLDAQSFRFLRTFKRIVLTQVSQTA